MNESDMCINERMMEETHWERAMARGRREGRGVKESLPMEGYLQTRLICRISSYKILSKYIFKFKSRNVDNIFIRKFSCNIFPKKS